jgi:hypothetical protein
MRTYQYLIIIFTILLATDCMAFEPGTIELGADMSFEVTRVYDEEIFAFELPDHLRVGVFALHNTSIVARLASSVVSTRHGQQSVNSFAFGLCLYSSRARRQFRSLLELMAMEDFMTGVQEGSQFGLALGMGVQGIHRLIKPRIEFIIERWFRSEYRARFVFKLVIGFSFYGGS